MISTDMAFFMELLYHVYIIVVQIRVTLVHVLMYDTVLCLCAF